MKILLTNHYPLSTGCRGQAVLSLIFIIGGIIVLIGLTMAFLATSFVESAYGFRIAQRAQMVAGSGVYDAMIRLNRTKGLSTNYSLTVGSDVATVTVIQDYPSTGFVTIFSSSTIARRTRSAKVTLSRNATSGLVSMVLWE